jgi:hypothetical protein
VKDIDKHKCLQPYFHAAFVYTRNHRETFSSKLLRNADARSRRAIVFATYGGLLIEDNRLSTLVSLSPFSLRFQPLHVDQMEDLGLDTKVCATAMGEAMAVMHWSARIDANNIPFVLAPPRDATSDTLTITGPLGDYCVWILDFNCCREMTLNEAGVWQACDAFFRNDLFYPRPRSVDEGDQTLCEEFWKEFLGAGERYLRVH